MDKIRKNGLWTRNFTIIIIGTIISAVGDMALDFAMSLSVFDETSSTWLSGVFAAVSLIPSIVIPVLAAPLVDRCSRKRMIVLMDSINSILFLIFFVFMHYRGFNYNAYIIFQLATGCAGSFYYLAYSALYPLLIPKGYTQKGYAVSGMVYPMVTAIMAPCSAIIYSALGLELIVLSEALLLGTAAFFESRISISGKPVSVENHNSAPQDNTKAASGTGRQGIGRDNLWVAVCRSVSGYIKEIGEGFSYMKRERGLRKLYIYMAGTNAASIGNSLMVRAYFQTAPVLTTAMYSFLTTAEMAGRILGGITHYFIEIPEDKKYKAARLVYIVYEIGDGVMLFLAYPLMLVVRFIAGFLGVNSAALREAAVSRYLPNHMRARVNAVNNTMMQAAMLIVNVIVGALGEIVDYRYVAAILSSVSLAGIYFLIIRGRKDVEKVFSVHLDDVGAE